MSTQAKNWVFENSPFSGASFLVHLVVADTVNPANNNQFWMDRDLLAKRCRLSVKSVSRALTELTEGGFLEVVRRPGGRIVYKFLNPEVQQKDTMSFSDPEPDGQQKDILSREKDILSQQKDTVSPLYITKEELKGTNKEKTASYLDKIQKEIDSIFPPTRDSFLPELEDGTKMTSQPNRTKGATPPTEASPSTIKTLFDSVWEVFTDELETSPSTATAKAQWAKAINEICEIDGLTPEWVRVKVQRAKERWRAPYIVTPNAIAKNWDSIKGSKPKPGVPGQRVSNVGDCEPWMWRRTTFDYDELETELDLDPIDLTTKVEY